ncbi:MAG: ATP-binding cassette domain-containing protein [Hallerella porci]|uniref:Peptide/nickel transport system ATP-binding protein n=1 Tax=Hallerella porci TaxID=1945871 RepID=A0ABX5LIB7_9BACT|nr:MULTISPECIES: ATP-binding cassette domain-containing protein [Hallerella]MCI5600018.1 ATP-binding cassette domain-containing protein [Hallerella sp.]MDY3922259.1 ATP-binding cassette domain-containing protein [Hallerella porci]PWK89643.1 peptide/nickel transport system ATP-binding protein [Hallerella porci]
MSESLKVENISVYYPMRSGVFSRVSHYFKAVQDVSFTLEAGEILAVIGESGCGKSTLAQALVGLLPWHSGSYSVFGKSVDVKNPKAFSEVRKSVQMVFQDPFSSLNPRQTVSQILTFPLMAQGISKKEAQKKAEQELEWVGLPTDSLERFPHEFSGGQRQRIGIARALMVDPKVIIADEVTSALDVSVQAQVLELLQKLRKELGISLVFISHDILLVRSFADKVIVMYKGKKMEEGNVQDVLVNPKHPYTQALIASVPTLDFDKPPKVPEMMDFSV